MMRVAIIVNSFPSPSHPYITEWVRDLRQRGIDVTVFTEQVHSKSVNPELFQDTDLIDRTQILNSISQPFQGLVRNLQSLEFNVSYWQRLVSAKRILLEEHSERQRKSWRKLYEYLPFMGQKFDVVHFNAPQIALRRFELGQFFCAKTLVSFRGQDFTFHPDRYDRLLRDADYLHFISQHLIEEATKRGYDGSKHTLIPPPVDTNFYYPPVEKLPNLQKPFRVFTAARFEWTKGWEYALQAVALLVQRGIDLEYYIAGDGSLKEALVYTIYELDLQDRVYLLGWLKPEVIREQMWQSDLYLLTSVEEAYNNSVLQAQACGLPVVCTNTGGLPENVKDGVTGFIAQSRNSWDIADKIEHFIRHPELKTTFSRNAVQHAKHNTSDLLTKQFITMYYKLANMK